MSLITECVPLASLHGRTVAVQLSIQGHDRVLKGRGIYEIDPGLGRILRVDLRSGGAQLLLAEASWNGEIAPGDSEDCDFLIRLT